LAKANQHTQDDGPEVGSFATDDGGQVGVGVIVSILVAVLVFAAVAPSISSGLNDTTDAFAHVSGATALLDIMPILLVVGVLLTLFLGRNASDL